MNTVSAYLHALLFDEDWLNSAKKEILEKRIVTSLHCIKLNASRFDTCGNVIHLYLDIVDNIINALPDNIQMECLLMLYDARNQLTNSQPKEIMSQNSKLQENESTESSFIDEITCVSNVNFLSTSTLDDDETSNTCDFISDKGKNPSCSSMNKTRDLLTDVDQACGNLTRIMDSSDSAFFSLLCELERDLRPQPDPSITDPSFLFLSESTSTELGSTVVFHVHIRGTPKLDVHWYKSGRPVLDLIGFRRCVIDKDNLNGRFALVLKDVRESDTGLYICAALNGSGKTNLNSIRLTVEELSTRKTIEKQYKACSQHDNTMEDESSNFSYFHESSDKNDTSQISNKSFDSSQYTDDNSKDIIYVQYSSSSLPKTVLNSDDTVSNTLPHLTDISEPFTSTNSTLKPDKSDEDDKLSTKNNHEILWKEWISSQLIHPRLADSKQLNYKDDEDISQNLTFSHISGKMHEKFSDLKSDISSSISNDYLDKLESLSMESISCNSWRYSTTFKFPNSTEKNSIDTAKSNKIMRWTIKSQYNLKGTIGPHSSRY